MSKVFDVLIIIKETEDMFLMRRKALRQDCGSCGSEEVHCAPKTEEVTPDGKVLSSII